MADKNAAGSDQMSSDKNLSKLDGSKSIKIEFIKLKQEINSRIKNKLQVDDLTDKCEELMLESAMMQADLDCDADAKLVQLFDFTEFMYKECVGLLNKARRCPSPEISSCSSSKNDEMFNMPRQPVRTVYARECAATTNLPLHKESSSKVQLNSNNILSNQELHNGDPEDGCY